MTSMKPPFSVEQWYRRMTTRQLEQAGIYLILSLLLVLTAAPFFSIVLAGFKTPVELTQGAFVFPNTWRWSNYAAAWQQAHFDWYFRNSLIVAAAVVLVSCFFSALAGFAFGLLEFRFKALLFVLFLLGLMAPQEAYIIPLYYLLRALKLLNTYWALILPQIGMSVCFGVFWMRGFFAALPRELIDAARVDGCNTWQLFWKVMLPNAWMAITTMAVLFFVWTWNDFLLALVTVTSDQLRTLPLGLALFQGRYSTNVPLVAAGAVIATLPTLLFYFILQRQFTQGITAGSLQG